MPDFSSGFDIVQILFYVVFAVVLCGFVFVAVKGISTWRKNNQSPRLTVEAFVASKRTDIRQHHSTTGTNFASTQSFSTTTNTRYYVTFQVESGDRVEFAVDGSEYGMIAEGDSGRLTFQGTRYISFERY
ncbi:MAG: DUF2500 domain-containing protein [Firmicutes bacterium]|nr:DUF2500 domain-containing protein [Bacillota bacterium]